MTMQLTGGTLSSSELHDLARRDRGRLVAARLRRVVRSLVRRIRAFVAARVLARVEREAIRTLQMLDDHMLADIGLTRGEIEFVVRNNTRPRS